ncbi:hypothetical protein [Aulosira sp. FACHB-615]|uniref:hypothetical protein n=1 Tax=Aulosira sp. FACHB-615 TaxID=2692777 RepID=UPI001687E166|nr:hypothetical protein [Aulosira sp. FACHB-615]MBD2490417.1 hypothetical protein [Aulosira sp. FACHB-615]
MPKATHIYEIMQNLDNLTLAELLVLKAKVDTLIEEKSSFQLYPLSGSYQRKTSLSSTTRDLDVVVSFPPITTSSSLKGHIIYASAREHSKLNESLIGKFLESQSNQDNSLEAVIDLVDEWMADESDYDEETYSSIEPALNRNQLSL